MSLRINQRRLTRVQRCYLQQIDERVREFPKSFGRADSGEDDYRSMASMIAMASADLSFKDRFLGCRTLPTKYDSRGTCGVRRFCTYCNYRLRQQALLTYVPAFAKGHWYLMTISATADLNIEFDELTYAWDAGKAVVRALLGAERFDGAYWTEELSLNSLYPEIRVNPHCHIIFHSDGEADTAAAMALAEQTYRRYFRNLRRRFARWRRNPERKYPVTYEDDPDDSVNLKPSIRLGELETQIDLYKALDYLTKTMRIVDPYRNALKAAGDDARWHVNAQFEQFLSGMLLMQEEDSPARKVKSRKQPNEPRPRSRIQRHSLGTLRPGRSRHFVGIRPADRPKYRDLLRAIRREIIEEREASRSAGDAGPMIDL